MTALGDERRSFSYYKAIPVIEKLPFKIESADQVKHLPGIGKSLQDHVSKYFWHHVVVVLSFCLIFQPYYLRVKDNQCLISWVYLYLVVILFTDSGNSEHWKALQVGAL